MAAHIMLLDDDAEQLRRLVPPVRRSLPFTVAPFMSPQAAIEALTDPQYNFVAFVLDIEMERLALSGISVAEAIRRQPAYVRTPIIFVTSHTHYGYGALSYLHYYEFFNKFESPDKLVNALRRALSVPGDAPVEPTDLTLQGSRMTYALNSCDIACIELFGRQVAVTDLLGKTQVYAVRHNAFQELCDQMEKLEDGCLQQIHRCIIVNTRRIRQIEWEKNTATVWLFNMDEGKPAGKTYVRRLDIFRR